MDTLPTTLDTPPDTDAPAAKPASAAMQWLRLAGPIVGVVLGAIVLDRALGASLNPYIAGVVILIAINVLLAVSLNIVNGFTGQFSIGHAGFMSLGAYTAGAIMYYGSAKLFGDTGFHGGLFSYTGRADFTGPLIGSGDLLFIVACLASGVVAAVAGYIVGLPSLRLRGDYLAIVTLGFGEIVRVLLQGTQGQIRDLAEIKATSTITLFNNLGGAATLKDIPRYTTLFWSLLWMGLVVLVAIRLKRSSYGRALLSVREDEIAALAVGVNTTRFKVRAFVISAFLTGIGGALTAGRFFRVDPAEYSFQRSFEILIMVVLGGLGSITGVVLAAILLTVLPEQLRDPPSLGILGTSIVALALGVLIFLTHKRRMFGPRTLAITTLVIVAIWQTLVWTSRAFEIDLAAYRMIIYSLMLIAVMLLRPQGLLGLNEAWDVVRYFKRKARA